MPKKTFKPKLGSYREILESAERRDVVLPDKFYSEVAKEASEVAFTVTSIESQTIMREIFRSLNKNLAEGGSYKKWQETFDVEPLKRLSQARQRTIFTNHSQTALNQGIYDVALDLENENGYLMYSSVLDSRTRQSHRKLDGIIRPVKDPFWQTHLPPNGHNCRCEIINVGKEDLANLKGLTTPKKLKQIRKDGGKPDNGFDRSKLKPVNSMKNLYRAKAKTLKPSLRKRFLQQLLLTTQLVNVWFERTKDQFLRDE